MNKTELIDTLHKKVKLPKQQIGLIVDNLIGAVITEVAGGGQVRLIGFGTFKSAKRKARTARNPQNGDAIEVPAKYVPAFTPGDAFKEAVGELDA